MTYSEKGKKSQNKHKIKSLEAIKRNWHKKDPIRVDIPLKSKYNNNIQLVTYKLFSSLTNGRGSWVVGRGYKSWVVGVGVGVGVRVSNITN